jgi:hypothetical protein
MGNYRFYPKIIKISNIGQGISNRRSGDSTSKFDIPYSAFCGSKTICNSNRLSNMSDKLSK